MAEREDEIMIDGEYAVAESQDLDIQAFTALNHADYLWLGNEQNPVDLKDSFNCAMHLIGLYKTIATDSFWKGHLARNIRLNPRNRASLSATITFCATKAIRASAASKFISVIQHCSQILSLADDYQNFPSFPFMELAVEMRRKIYKNLLGNKRSVYTRMNEAQTIARREKQMAAQGASFIGSNIGLIMTNSIVRGEMYTMLLEEHTIHFPDTESLHIFLRDGTETTRSFLTSIRVNWFGHASSRAFGLLANCPKLLNLEIIVSYRLTRQLLRERESFYRQLFPESLYNWIRLIDCDGGIELSNLRGLKDVSVTRFAAGDNHSTPRFLREIRHFETFLKVNIRTPRPSEGAQVEQLDDNNIDELF